MRLRGAVSDKSARLRSFFFFFFLFNSTANQSIKMFDVISLIGLIITLALVAILIPCCPVSVIWYLTTNDDGS
jgi:hypothetical protein